ncbi:NADH:flavin oxidoreductase/NADH oxidase [Novilysobacter spongiicola]|uniref:2,4-dienoyl-CoA reductase n=1 Tax=Lysobacter spongiicola DSM 21749 TaxID=1122188 RepID=A0A1T4N2G2_9GAMM|nr:NADH:flavin oxidoreductase/NADH oxidase [Lysobacter spongiicola]SJZ73402.1 2,4-dienoyl-CoA reductase [Lysobacter spongiicola DSM 21749]
MSRLFDPLTQRDLVFRNRIIVSPMCQYSAHDGVPNEWHMVHLGSRAVGGAAAVIAEASAVSPEGRISPADTGLWNDTQAQAWSQINAFIEKNGAIAGVQLAHAGRKASTDAPWRGGGAVDPAQGGWTPVAPSALAFDAGSPVPDALDEAGIKKVVADFAAATRRALDAGFRLIEIHAAHGYLLHQFLSPLANQRDDRYGGSFENRIRLTLEVIDAVRAALPERLPLWLRISATDWVEGEGWDIEQSVELARLVKERGVDLVDVSSGGTVPKARIPVGPGYQAPFAARIRRETGIATGAVGLLTEPAQVERIIAEGEADVVLLARELLRDPYFPRRAAAELGGKLQPPDQYGRAW